MATVRVMLCQKSLGVPVTQRDIRAIREYGARFVCFPEYFFVNRRLGNHGQTSHNQAGQLRRMTVLSRELGCVVIGGTMPERADGVMYNTSFVFDRGAMLGRYRKRNLFFAEEGIITPGSEYQIFEAGGITFGVLICADIFHDEAFHFMRERGARIIFSPTFSPRRDETPETKFRRDNELYARAASIAGATIVKVCGVPDEYRDFIQARSLVAAPGRILFRVQPYEEDRELLIGQEIEIEQFAE